MKSPTECIIPVIIHPSAGENPLFGGISELKVSKPLLMKYGIMVLEAPNKTKNGDLDYFKSKMPSFIDLYGDWVNLEQDRIINLSNDPENKTKISEIVGVGVGLLYASKLLNVNPNRISKILPGPKITKRLDYSITKANEQYEVETKGITDPGSLNAKVKQCKEKKAEQEDKTKMRFGVITVLNSPSDARNSNIMVCDDPEEKRKITKIANTKNILSHYELILSFVLKAVAYNKFVRFVTSLNKKVRLPIDKEKFFGEYNHNGAKYFGAFFDKRFIIKKIKEYKKQKISLENLYQKLTEDAGETKYFVGINERVIDLINRQNWDGLEVYDEDITIQDYSENGVKISDADGILFVKSVNKQDPQIEENLPDSKTKKEVGYILDYLDGITHQCGQPCKSWHIKGKPCEIRTYGGSCHYH